MTQISKDKRIAKNTMILYIRMIIMMLISLYTSRVVLSTLGFEDYGIYQVVGGVIVLFSFLNNGLATASNRFITAEIANGNYERSQKVFNVCFQSHLLVALIILILAETIGLWVVNTILNIPNTRIFAANIVYQLSVISTIVGIVNSPFNTTLVAYERMDIFAYLAIFDAIMKLFIVYLIQVIYSDRLILYAAFLLIVTILHFFLNYIYCINKLEICRLKRVKDIPLLKSIFNFTSWSLLGQSCIVATNQGVSVLINYYCGVVVNAAMGISNQIINIVNQFVSNFQMAFRPQIVKSYVNKDYDYLQSLIIRSSKITSCLMMVLIIPIIIELPHLLNIWLGDFPRYSIEFARWTLISLFFDNITSPLWMTINAQTDIKKYQIYTSLFFSMNFFIGWIILRVGVLPPYSVMIVRIIVFIMLIAVRLHFTKKFFKMFNIREWLVQVMSKSIVVFVISFVCGYILSKIMELSMLQELFCVVLLSEIVVCTLCYLVILSNSERLFIKNTIKKKILHII